MTSAERKLQSIKSWFHGDSFAEITIPQTTFVEFQMQGTPRHARIHYSNSLVRSRGIGGIFNSLEITRKHPLCARHNGPSTEINFHVGPMDGPSLLRDLEECVSTQFEGWATLKEFMNPYFLENGNLIRNTSGVLGSGPVDLFNKFASIMKRHGVEFRLTERFGGEIAFAALVMDSMYVVAEDFRIEIL